MELLVFTFLKNYKVRIYEVYMRRETIKKLIAISILSNQCI